jgi:hypothetical protein
MILNRIHNKNLIYGNLWKLFRHSSLSKQNLNLAKLENLSTKNINEPNVINLSYDLSDKFESNKALIISHGLFASKASWRAMARRINEITKQRVLFLFHM